MSGIGADPVKTLQLTVETGGDFEDVVRWQAGDFPDGSEVELIIGDELNTPAGLAAATVYELIIAGDSATIKVESEVCDLWEGQYRLRYRDTTTTPTTERIVCGGKIKRT